MNPYRDGDGVNINFFAPINNLGYGIHSYNLLKEFEALGHGVTLVPPFGQVRFSNPQIERWLKSREDFDPDAPGVMIFNEEYLAQFYGRPRIGFPVFECERFTPLQLAMIKSCDYVFTPSKWGKDILIKNGILAGDIRVVNEGFDPEVFPFREKSTSEEMGEPFTFVHVGKFEARKGTLQLIECFFRALENEEARLVLHVDNPFLKDGYKELYAVLSRFGFIPDAKSSIWRRAGLSVRFSAPVDTQAELAPLYAMADCGLYPSRAEGWGLPILETLATGVPCIAGAWTGQSEYIDKDDFLIIPEGLSRRAPAADGVWFSGDRGDWHEVPDEVLIKTIKRAYDHAREERKSESWKNVCDRIRCFTWARAARQFEEAIKDVCV